MSSVLRAGGFRSFLALLAFTLIATPEARASSRGCWDPTEIPEINKALTPVPEFHENAATINLIHDHIWAHRNEIDPRLVYHRIVGETGGDPKKVLSRGLGGAYGIFQFSQERQFGMKDTPEQALKKLYKANPNVSPRLIQVRYYLETYVQNSIRAADSPRGACGVFKKFKQYSNLEKAAYLGFGCEKTRLAHEASLCTKVATYREGSCKFSKTFIRNNTGPALCDRQIPKSLLPPGTGTGTGSPSRPAQPRRSAG
jgi:hypothetical protein